MIKGSDSCKMSLVAANNYVCSLRPGRFGVASGGDPVFGSYEIKKARGCDGPVYTAQ